MKTTVNLTLNGTPRRLSVHAQRPLLEVLREDLDLTGTKFGCGEGQCGACTVLIDGKPTRSCVTEIEQVKDREVLTIEGLASEEGLHPVQEAFLTEQAMQCGYCVPGMILSVTALLQTTPNPSMTEIRTALNGNLCRCCGYQNILKAVQRAIDTRKAQP